MSRGSRSRLWSSYCGVYQRGNRFGVGNEAWGKFHGKWSEKREDVIVVVVAGKMSVEGSGIPRKMGLEFEMRSSVHKPTISRSTQSKVLHCHTTATVTTTILQELESPPQRRLTDGQIKAELGSPFVLSRKRTYLSGPVVVSRASDCLPGSPEAHGDTCLNMHRSTN